MQTKTNNPGCPVCGMPYSVNLQDAPGAGPGCHWPKDYVTEDFTLPVCGHKVSVRYDCENDRVELYQPNQPLSYWKRKEQFEAGALIELRTEKNRPLTWDEAEILERADGTYYPGKYNCE